MFKLTGKNAELMLARLKSWHLKDGNGIEGDSLTLDINSSDIDGIPPKGEQYTVYLDDIKRDVFQITQRTATMQPRTVQIVLTVAPFMADSTEFLKRQSASWDNTTLAQIVSDVVTPFGYDIFVHPRFQKIQIEHSDRTDESAPAFLNRLAKQFDALAKPVERLYLFVPIGESQSASGKQIETITLTKPAVNRPDLANFINVSTDLDSRSGFSGVKAFYVTTNDGQRHEVSVGESPFKQLGKDKNSESEATQAAGAELRKLQRQGRKVTIEAPPNPKAFAEGLIVLDASFPQAFQGQCSIDSVEFSGQGLQPTHMTIHATLTGE
ncbi:hypothetical protein [Celerinatantimonas sp. MCCC 1A17872]|uniref:hypothetical protein n=1 Tax=Celerinatantimonas sp. MCCC 1A17872 TaxID=3177514 RepID=UPI0038C15C14